MRKLLVALLCVAAMPLYATELQFNFKSPAFSGVGFSSHVLTIENLEQTRRQKIMDDKVAAASKAASDAKNTNLAKFINNLESRVYATLSQKIAEQLFSDNGATSGTFSIATNNVQWSSDGSQITLRITDAAGSVTEVVVPYGSLAW
jgi:Type VIII secretion system (T8SS), CsgF protein